MEQSMALTRPFLNIYIRNHAFTQAILKIDSQFFLTRAVVLYRYVHPIRVHVSAVFCTKMMTQYNPQKRSAN